ncbi:hypothetical protein [Ruegeria lacuscaerulensis]|uniref:hypothetical protein n=1 Tax=Ruegeria lacuscaerulensis TaxID=55218 RepID=UPI00147B82F5|nr:hypothetical protein [Ruegeria lacuscaerulensis]
MNDFKNLSKQRQTLLKIKIDGYLEATVLAARANNIGLSEAVFLAMQGLVRGLVANSIEKKRAEALFEAALQSVSSETPSQFTRH